MNKMKFRRFMYRLLKFSLFGCAIASTAGLFSFLVERRNDKIRSERRRGTLIAVLICVLSTAAAAGGLFAAIHEIRKRRGGYLFDFFDRDEYDVVEPDEEDGLVDMIRGELNGNEGEGSDSEVIRPADIPLDDEDTADNYRQ